MDIDLFDFELPENLIAQTPLVHRLESRLLVLDKSTGELIHNSFSDLIQYLEPGDTLVLNNTKVIPARLIGVKATSGAKIEVLLLKNLGEHRWEVLAKPGKRIHAGTVLHFGQSLEQEPLLTAVVEEEGEMGIRVIRFSFTGIFTEILDQLGQMPLPPYIKQRLEDKNRYQTVYALEDGSAAAPTAGLHFTKPFLQEIEDKGISLVYVTLHVGLGTFRPVAVEQIEEHVMHEEYYSLSTENAQRLNEARARKGRMIAVGTTSARTLETLARRFGESAFVSCQGWTNIFIYPGYEFQIVNALLTNFHLPKSSLVMMVSALAGRDQVMKAYQEAIAAKYRFFSFGDAMLIH